MSEDITGFVSRVSVNRNLENKENGRKYARINIGLEGDGRNFSKLAKNDVEIDINPGDQVYLTFNTNGNFTNLVELPKKITAAAVEKSEPASKSTQTRKTTPETAAATVKTAEFQTPQTTTTWKDNSQGQRNGMVTKAAVDVAIARKEFDIEGMQQAALDVIELTKFVEKQS